MPHPDEFLDTMLPGVVEAETALHNGDARARIVHRHGDELVEDQS